MNKLAAISLSIIILAIVAAFLFSGDDSSGSDPIIKEIPSGKTFTIEMTSQGFSPGTINIKQYDSIIFVNLDETPHWPASNVHPSHEVYPGTNIEKCNSEDKNKIFDACEGVEKGESFTFQFNLPGKWGYHDHLNPAMSGIISIEPEEN